MKPDFEKGDGLLPAIVQDQITRKVLMMGYMNEAALAETERLQKVTFFSRSKQRLWTKGESSENYLHLVSWSVDCDRDTILVMANPAGPACHLGTGTCWGDENFGDNFIYDLEGHINDRKVNPKNGSYTNLLFNKGINKVAQKVGEEAVELVIEAKDDNKDLFLGEAADLMYHYLVLLAAKDIRLSEVVAVLKDRHQ